MEIFFFSASRKDFIFCMIAAICLSEVGREASVGDLVVEHSVTFHPMKDCILV